MLDTKLKNRHKLAVVIIILTILISADVMISQYREAYYEMAQNEELMGKKQQASEEFMKEFVNTCYILYNTESGSDVQREHAEQFEEFFAEYTEEYDNYYETFIPLLDYRVTDERGSVIAKTMASSDGKFPTEQNMNDYAIGMVIAFDENGKPSADIREGAYKKSQSGVLNRILNNFQDMPLAVRSRNFDSEYLLKTPANRTYYLAMRAENVEEYVQFMTANGWGMTADPPGWFYSTMLILMVIVGAVALLLPTRKSFHTGDERIFKVPFEIPLILLGMAVTAAVNTAEAWLRLSGGNENDGMEFLTWSALFAVVYWSVSCIRRIFAAGSWTYMKEHSLCVLAAGYIKRAWKFMTGKCREGLDYLYHSFDNLDFSEKNNRTILKLVMINFVILLLVTSMWFAGIPALIIYSVILFYILRKYFNDLKDKYALLLKATNQMAQGKLDVEIDEDLGVFNPFKTEIRKIQDGYQKAVEKEVKSQRMKTDLITNVSHDLKTPLTAIITYVNLLKDEKDEEKRADYIDVLDRKSLRLKALIEDLFEISKASSKNVSLHLVDVDVVNLFKQVRLELSEKFEASELDFRCTYPEEKAVAKLDSQKTYRIFENLLVNVVKYALPKTRVYVKIEKKNGEVLLHIMNISATELTFCDDEITERFVRGDAARNTEGSGLGLAIAKSFAELQKGRFKIETEGDLFKAEVAFPAEE